MIYKIEQYNNKLVKNAYDEGMRDLNKFFNINWSENLPAPNVCILNNQKEIDFVRQYKTQRWVVGFIWPGNRTAYILDNNCMSKESSHKKYSDNDYYSLIKHELCHIFYDFISCGHYKPVWLSEGVSVYFSGQIEDNGIVTNFSNFLKYYDNGGMEVYNESGTAIKLLFNNFGKKKLLELITFSKEVKDKKEFVKLFKKIYGFDLNYKNFNHLLSK